MNAWKIFCITVALLVCLHDTAFANYFVVVDKTRKTINSVKINDIDFVDYEQFFRVFVPKIRLNRDNYLLFSDNFSVNANPLNFFVLINSGTTENILQLSIPPMLRDKKLFVPVQSLISGLNCFLNFKYDFARGGVFIETNREFIDFFAPHTVIFEPIVPIIDIVKIVEEVEEPEKILEPANIGQLEINHLEISNLEFANTEVADLKPDSLEIADSKFADIKSDNLEFVDSKVVNLKSDNFKLTDSQVVNLKSDNLEIADSQVANLKSDNIELADSKIVNLKSDNLELADSQVVNLKSDNLEVADSQVADLKPDSLELADAKVSNLKVDNLEVADTELTNLKTDHLKINDYTVEQEIKEIKQEVSEVKEEIDKKKNDNLLLSDEMSEQRTVIRKANIHQLDFNKNIEARPAQIQTIVAEKFENIIDEKSHSREEDKVKETEFASLSIPQYQELIEFDTDENLSQNDIAENKWHHSSEQIQLTQTKIVRTQIANLGFEREMSGNFFFQNMQEENTNIFQPSDVNLQNIDADNSMFINHSLPPFRKYSIPDILKKRKLEELRQP